MNNSKSLELKMYEQRIDFFIDGYFDKDRFLKNIIKDIYDMLSYLEEFNSLYNKMYFMSYEILLKTLKKSTLSKMVSFGRKSFPIAIDNYNILLNRVDYINNNFFEDNIYLLKKCFMENVMLIII